jgi:hypothetical protein
VGSAFIMDDASLLGKNSCSSL